MKIGKKVQVKSSGRMGVIRSVDYDMFGSNEVYRITYTDDQPPPECYCMEHEFILLGGDTPAIPVPEPETEITVIDRMNDFFFPKAKSGYLECECGACYTSFPDVHADYCPKYKKD